VGAARELLLDRAQRRLGLAQRGAHRALLPAAPAHALVLLDLIAEEAAIGRGDPRATRGLPARLELRDLGAVRLGERLEIAGRVAREGLLRARGLLRSQVAPVVP